MSWGSMQIQAAQKLEALGFTRSTEPFNIERTPQTILHKSFSLMAQSYRRNEQFQEVFNRFFPNAVMIVSVGFDLGNNSQSFYDAAWMMNEIVIATVADPANRSAETRLVRWQDSQERYVTDNGNWLIISNRFDVEHTIDYTHYVTGGTATTFTLTLEQPPSVYNTDQVFVFKMHTTNTGAATLNINGLGAKQIKKFKDAALIGGEMEIDKLVSAVYDGTVFQIL